MARDFVTEPSPSAEPLRVSSLRASVSRAAQTEAPVLFLDVDGVLNCRTSWERYPRRHFHMLDEEKIELLNEVCRATGCRVTVASTWRRDTKCRRLLRNRGFRGRFSRDWRTDWLRTFAEPDLVRGDEIADWLKRNGSPAYAIVDDDSDMLPEQMPRFVQTSFEDGLTQTHADRLIALLAPAQGMEARKGRGEDSACDSPVGLQSDAPS